MSTSGKKWMKKARILDITSQHVQINFRYFVRLGSGNIYLVRIKDEYLSAYRDWDSLVDGLKLFGLRYATVAELQKHRSSRPFLNALRIGYQIASLEIVSGLELPGTPGRRMFHTIGQWRNDQPIVEAPKELCFCGDHHPLILVVDETGYVGSKKWAKDEYFFQKCESSMGAVNYSRLTLY